MTGEQPTSLLDAVLRIIGTTKATDTVAIDVSDHSSVTDHMVVCTGTSRTHVGAIADHLARQLSRLKVRTTLCGKLRGEWVVVDAGEVVVHVMQPAARELYALEDLYRAGHAPR
ncbi:MAG: ribosome silencing factor [Succinivibrionaceae bacterium]|nr:ribosome silencing factor [Succinivibrionaceae bacterium]